MSRSLINALPASLMLAAAVSVAPAVLANPTNVKPENALQAHGTIKGVKPGCEDAEAAVKRFYDKHETLIAKAAKLDEQKADPGRIPHMQLAKDFGQLWKDLRDIDHLKLMGEPAGVDLYTKVSRLYTKIGRLAYHGIAPNPGQFRQRIIAKLRNETQKRERFLDQQEQKMSSGGLEAAEKAMEAFGIELKEQVCFLSPKDAEPFVKRYNSILSTLDSALNKKRAGLYGQQANAAMTKNMDGARFFAEEAARIRGEIAASGTTKIEGNSQANAADAVEYLGGLWGNASAGLLRRTAMLWVYRPSNSSEVQAEASRPVKQLETAATNAIKDVISAAADKASAEDARALYPQILEKLTIIDRRVGAPDVSKACEGALQKLAAKDPDLPTAIEAYQRATAEPLRWRKLFASRKATAYQKQYSSTDSFINKKVKITQSLKPIMYGSFSTSERPLLLPTFGQPASWTVFENSPFLVDTKAYTDDTIRISPNSRTSVVPYGVHQYSNVAVGFDLQKEMDALTAVLNVDDDHPPLSVAAANALSAAELRDFESIGGEIKQIHLEAVVTRFIALPDGAYMLSFLGNIPSIDDNAPAITQTCWRFDIQPHWVQHEYFTYAVNAAMN